MNKLYYILYFLFFTMFSTVAEARSNSILFSFDCIYQSSPQVISFNTFTVMRYGDEDFLLTATSDSGLEVSYSSADTSIAEVYQDSNNGNRWKLKINAVGSVVITAYQAGNEIFDEAVPVSQNLVINAATLTISAVSKSKLYNEVDPELTYNVVGLVNADEESTVLSGELARAEGEDVGTYPILQGSLLATSSYTINYVGANFQITRAPLPDITFENETFVYDGTPKSIVVKGDIPSEVVITYTGNEQINAGAYTVSAFIDGGINYVSETLTATLEITKSPQTITWTQSLITGCSGETQIILDATASSGLPIQYSSSNLNVATINGNILTINTAGYSDIRTYQLGNQNYLETDTIRKLNVRLIGKVKQKWNDVLVFDNTSNKYVSWQWYRDNSILTGATRQYYTSAPSALSGIYHTVVEDTDKNFMETCPFNVLDGISKGGIKVSPNPSPRNANIRIVLDYTEEELKGARLLIVDLTGNIYREFAMVSPEINIPSPSNPNMYIIYLYFATGDKTTVKLLVN